MKEEKLIGLFVLWVVHRFRFSYIFQQVALKVEFDIDSLQADCDQQCNPQASALVSSPNDGSGIINPTWGTVLLHASVFELPTALFDLVTVVDNRFSREKKY